MEFKNKGFIYPHTGENGCEVWFTAKKPWILALQMAGTNYVFKDSKSFRWLMNTEPQTQYKKINTVFWLNEGSLVIFMRQLENGKFILSRVTDSFLLKCYLANNFDSLEKTIQWVVNKAIEENDHA